MAVESGEFQQIFMEPKAFSTSSRRRLRVMWLRGPPRPIGGGQNPDTLMDRTVGKPFIQSGHDAR